MMRYSSARPQAVLCMLRPPAALIVDLPGASEEPLKKTLEEQGCFVKSCAGPGRTRCPILEGKPCPLRESVNVAVVYMDPELTWPGTGMLPRLRCAADSSSPGVIALQGRLDQPRYGRGKATMGALSGTKAILDTIDTVMSQESS